MKNSFVSISELRTENFEVYQCTSALSTALANRETIS